MGSQVNFGKLYSPIAKEAGVDSHASSTVDDVEQGAGVRPDPKPVLIQGDFGEPSTEPSRSLHRPILGGGKVRLFGHYVPLQFLFLGGVEFMAFTAAAWLAIHAAGGLQSSGATALLPATLPVSLALVLCFGALGLYSAHQRADLKGVLSRAVLAVVVAVVGLQLAYLVFPTLALEAGVLVAAMVFSSVSFGLIRGVFYRHLDGNLLVRRVLVIGTGKRANSIERLRRKSDQRGFRLVGFVSTASDAGSAEVDPERVVTSSQRFCRYALENRIDEIVVALDDRRQGAAPTDELLNCRMSGIDVTDMLDFFERETAKIRLDLLRPSWLIHSDGFRRHILRDFSKRVFDIGLSAVLFVVMLPLMLLTAAAISIESGGRGSVFYRQERVGQNGKSFDLIKFRSMRMDAEKDGKARWASENDPRITRVGNFIRKYRLDELPQLWNVLRNDMSIVGPRPERPEFVEQLAHLSPLYKERHRVKPGIAGWAQLRYPYGASQQDSIEKLQYDLYYVKNHRLLFDLYILVQTVEVVMYTKGAR